jgi:hypothetical protein
MPHASLPSFLLDPFPWQAAKSPDRGSAFFERIKSRNEMPYCITLRSRTDRKITGWYDGSDSRWSTDLGRQKIFETKRDAEPACHELRKLCPSNANLINIEPHNFASGTRGSASFELRGK